MNVIFTCICLVYLIPFPFTKLSCYFSDAFFIFSINNLSSIFWCKTMWNLHLHCVCTKLFLSCIGHASFFDEIWWSGNQPYLIIKRGFFCLTLEALWTPRHSQGFSKTIKNLVTIKPLDDNQV